MLRRMEMRRVRITGLLVAIGLCVSVSCAERASTSTPPSSEAPPEVASTVLIECDGTKIVASEPSVRPRPDGIHVSFDNTSPETVIYELRYGGTGEGDALPEGESERVLSAPPGDLGISCGDEQTTITVVDPDGLWRPTELSCGSQTTGIADFAGTPPTLQDPTEDATQVLEAHGAGTVAQAGYPEADDRFFTLTRDGEIVAVTSYYRSEAGWSWSGETSNC
jgi:hypothetical protein